MGNENSSKKGGNNTATTKDNNEFDGSEYDSNNVISVELIDKGTYSLIPSKLNPNDNDVLKVVCISDTHRLHGLIKDIPFGDILIHAGDFTNVGEINDVISYDTFVRELLYDKKFKKCVVIAGNHDITFDPLYYEETGKHKFHYGKSLNTVKNDDGTTETVFDIIQKNNIYLEDTGINLFGIHIWGSPHQPYFCNWAFNIKSEYDMNNKWDKANKYKKDNNINNELDILITHGPPYLHGDSVVFSRQNVGSKSLLKQCLNKIKPKFHIFGHIHEGYGVTQYKGSNTYFINASTVNVNYKVTNKPIMFYIKASKAVKTSNNINNDINENSNNITTDMESKMDQNNDINNNATTNNNNDDENTETKANNDVNMDTNGNDMNNDNTNDDGNPV